MREGSFVLLVDAGNSRVKWASGTAQGLSRQAPFLLEEGEALRRRLDRAWASLPTPAQVLVSNVAGTQVGREIAGWLHARWGLQPRFAAAAAEACGVRNAYADPALLGVDRWLALIGAARCCGGPLMVADCGTALTVDALDAGGQHLGGVIAPGLRMLGECLRARIGLEAAEPAVPGSLLGSSTAQGIAAGSMAACAGLIEHLHGRIELRLEQSVTLLLTGGDAETVARALHCPARIEPDLVLRGLACWGGWNCGSGSIDGLQRVEPAGPTGKA